MAFTTTSETPIITMITTSVSNTTTATTPANTTAITTAAAITLPCFWPTKTELWFRMAEAKFELAHPKITKEDTRFNHVLSVLSPEIAEEVADVITKPDPVAPYSKLKEAIINRTSLSDTQRLRQLLSGEELGNRKPSQLLLRRMRQLVNDSRYVNDQVMKELFFQQMPVNIKLILVSLGTLNLEQIADVADRILESTPGSSIVAVKKSIERNYVSTPEVNTVLISLVDKLSSLVERLDSGDRSRNCSRHANFQQHGHSRKNSKSRQPSESPKILRNCWYHHRFGNGARKCISPCDFSKNEESKQ